MNRYFVSDVFTKHRFGGNPLAIIPDASDLPEVDFQRIAREFNFIRDNVCIATRDPSTYCQDTDFFSAVRNAVYRPSDDWYRN